MRRHLTYANVVATLALVVAVAGGSTAVAISASKKAPKNSVTSAAIRDGSVTAKDLAGVRYESALTNSNVQTLNCQPGEQLLSGGWSSPAEVTADGPTQDGQGWLRANAPGGGVVSILCLRATPGK